MYNSILEYISIAVANFVRTVSYCENCNLIPSECLERSVYCYTSLDLNTLGHKNDVNDSTLWDLEKDI